MSKGITLEAGDIIATGTPVVTVFDEKEKPDYEGNKKVIDFLIEGGVDGILVLGSSGEFTGLTKQEKHDFFKFYADILQGAQSFMLEPEALILKILWRCQMK